MKIRVSLFCSLYRGEAMIEAIKDIHQKFPEVVLVGVASDDPTKPWVNPEKRIWKHVQSKKEVDLVKNLAEEEGIPFWNDQINTEKFLDIYLNKWKPDVCYMGVFGQKIPEKIWSYPLFGFYNFHTCGGESWPSDVGGNPIGSLLARKKKRASIAMHEVDNKWDHGELVAFSDFFPINKHDNPLNINKLSSRLVREMIIWHISGLIGKIGKEKPPREVAKKRTSLYHAA